MSREQERAELHRTIWAIANELRGSVDGWDFKNYVLGFLFYRFISEDLTAHINASEEEAGNTGFNYATDVTDADIDDDIRKQTIDEKGYFIYPTELFQNVAATADTNENLNITLANIFKNIEGSAIGTESEQDMKGLFSDIDVNSPKLGGTTAKRNELLAKIMLNIGQMDLGGDLRNAKIDAFGDAYEFLMTMYASNAGKSGGEFFTPQEVAELLARIACDGKGKINKVYDPACGSGSLLLKFAKVLGPEKAQQVSFYGQEINITTYNLCRINMFLHHVPFNMFDIRLGDTLIEPKHLADEPFDAIVSNPPYSTRWAGDSNPLLINDDRYSPAGVLAPKTKADLAFTMHMLHHLATTGTAAIVEFPGVLYRGGAEQKIRQYLIENNYVDCVIQLPANLFFGVGIATCIIVLKKSKSDNNVLFIDASEECVKDGNKNKLTDDNIQSVFDFFTNREDVEYKAKLVSCKDILANDSNLSVSSYVEKEDKRDKIDIEDLNAEIAELNKEITSLACELDEIVKGNICIDTLIKKFCPEGVDKKTLSSLCRSICTGLNPRTNFRLNEDGATNKYVTVKEIATNKIVFSDSTDRISNKAKEIINRRSHLEKGDILFSGIGTIGKVVYVDMETENWDCSESVFLLKPNESVCGKYLAYTLISKDVVSQYESCAAGAIMRGVRKATLESLQIPLPPLPIQQEIVSVLDSFTTLIDKMKQETILRQKQYEYYREQLLTF